MSSEDPSDVNTLTFGPTLPSSSAYAIMSLSEVYLLLSSTSSSGNNSVLDSCLNYSKRFNNLGNMSGITDMEKENRGRNIEDLKELLLQKTYSNPTTGEETRLHKYEASKLIDLMSLTSDPEEAFCLIPSLEGRFSNEDIGEILEFVKRCMRNFT